MASSTGRFSPERTAPLVSRTLKGEHSMISLAQRSAAAMSWAAGTTSLTRPRREASCAVTRPSVVQSAPMNFGPQPGHELIAEGKDPKNGAELSFVQWLRFGSAGYLRMLGIARRDAWDEAFPRMRALRDGIEPK